MDKVIKKIQEKCSLYKNGKCTLNDISCDTYCVSGAIEFKKQLQRAKAENERLKAKNNDLCKALKDKEFDRLIQSERKLKNLKQANIYSQALQEIRGYILSLNYESKELRTIQDKINEVIGANQ